MGKILQMQGQSKCLSASTLQTQIQNMRSPTTSYLNDDGCSSFYHNTTRTMQIKTQLSMSMFCWISYIDRNQNDVDGANILGMVRGRQDGISEKHLQRTRLSFGQ